MTELARRRRALMGAAKSGRIPGAFQEVEWIGSETAGGPYIDTGVVPVVAPRVVCDIQINDVSTTNRYPFGLATAVSGKMFRVRWTTQVTNMSLFYGTENGFVCNPLKAVNALNVWNTWDVSNEFILNGTTYKTVATAVDYSDNTYQIRLFKADVNGFPMKVRECKIYDGAELKADLVPCYHKADSVVGMYDLVSGSFKTNAGTGTFTKGADV